MVIYCSYSCFLNLSPEASSPVGELQVSDNTCPVKSVSYAQIVLKSLFFRLDQAMLMCSPKCASPNTDAAYLQLALFL